MKRRITGVLLLFCLAAPIAAMFTFLHYQKKQVRKNVKHQIVAGLDRSELVLLKFTRDECESTLQWKHSKEFEFNGSMYDIVEAEVKDGKVHFWCWWDNKETKLNQQLDNLLVGAWNNDPAQRRNKEHLNQLYKSLFIETHPISTQKPYVDQERAIIPYEFGFLTRAYPPPVPPPRIG